MPYARLPLGPGTHSLGWKVIIWAHPTQKFVQPKLVRLADSEIVEFDFTVW
jgi:hypothetical protein